MVTNETELPDGDAETDVGGAETDDSVVPDNYSMPYFSPLIFVPPIPFVPGK